MLSFFESYGINTPSESSCRRKVPEVHKNNVKCIENILSNNHCFIICDEASIEQQKFFHVLVGRIDNPKKIFLYKSKTILGNINSDYVIHEIDQVTRDLSLKREQFNLFITDAAPYIVKAGQFLSKLFPDMFHTTCVAHLLHNCANKVQAHYNNVNNLIASVKLATVKNDSRRPLFQQYHLK